MGEFHTHPNPDIDEKGNAWQESPGTKDVNGIRAEGYSGDSYVIGHKNVYQVTNKGTVSVVGKRSAGLAP